jgi:class 3 adenylate cyclase/tetratricopeptide (TPR) repeat protein
LVCPACQVENHEGARFCAECGNPLALRCQSCGAGLRPGQKFCDQCGTALTVPVGASQAPESASAAASVSGSVSERRLVSVLFVDLVGFTTLSENRDPEEVRELLSIYFDRCRTLIERYGGTVEKFIGDAVMAVWGTPVAREDDPERAVRAALALTVMVTALGEEAGMPELRVRAGVLTGSAAVEIGAEAEGMVIGDTVNAASRLQSIAAPGTVVVDDVTRRASEAAIAYEDRGSHELKGREQPVRAWTALRVVAGAGGAKRGAGLEAPLVGRDRELQTIIESFEATEREGGARIVTVVGEAGSGKSRLLWEFFKYIDGIKRIILWHQGRCLSYGDGVAYWALAEMVRVRAGIVEEEDTATSRQKLRAAVEEFVSDERERRLVEPRLAHLLGLEQRTANDRADLFSGWRLFFERIAESEPVVLAFEDLQHADSGLLDFIDYLLEWSAQLPIFILALGRPELLTARPGWEATITLDSLDDTTMGDLLAGLVPGLPDELQRRIVSRAEGMPLYAVETVRMLLDRGLLAQDGSRYVVTGDIDELEVPETLHALAAARLDGLTTTGRSVLQDAAVYGSSFTPAGVAALGTVSEDEVRRVLQDLVARQIVGFNDDKLSAERGQFHFLQGLLRTTAYGTLSRRDRKSRHLAAARHLQEAWGDDAPELAEVLAAHLLDAAGAEPDAADAPQIRAMASDTLADAGERALSLALGPEAQRAFEHAAELAADEHAHATLLDKAGQAAHMNTDYAAARERFERAVEIFQALGDREAASRSLTGLAYALYADDRLDEAMEISRRAVTGLADGTPEKAGALAELARSLAFHGELAEAEETATAALTIAEPLQQLNTVLEAFGTIAFIRFKQGRIYEATAFRRQCLELALDHELTGEALRNYNNLANIPLQQDRFAEAVAIAEPGLTLATERGNRRWEQSLSSLIASAKVAMGQWDGLPELSDAGELPFSGLARLAYMPALARVTAARGDTGALREILKLAGEHAGSSNIEYAAAPVVALAIALRALGRDTEALQAAVPIAIGPPEIPNEDRREAYVEAGLSALAVGDERAVEQLAEFVADLPPVKRSPLLRAGAARFTGLLAARRGDTDIAGEQLNEATRELRAIDAPFVLAQILLEHAEVLHADGRDDQAAPLLIEATEIFTRLRATPYLERAQTLHRQPSTKP